MQSTIVIPVKPQVNQTSITGGNFDTLKPKGIQLSCCNHKKVKHTGSFEPKIHSRTDQRTGIDNKKVTKSAYYQPMLSMQFPPFASNPLSNTNQEVPNLRKINQDLLTDYNSYLYEQELP
jgi:hypothetical protein